MKVVQYIEYIAKIHYGQQQIGRGSELISEARFKLILEGKEVV